MEPTTNRRFMQTYEEFVYHLLMGYELKDDSDDSVLLKWDGLAQYTMYLEDMAVPYVDYSSIFAVLDDLYYQGHQWWRSWFVENTDNGRMDSKVRNSRPIL